MIKHTQGPWKVYKVFDKPLIDRETGETHLSHWIMKKADDKKIGEIYYCSEDAGYPSVKNVLEMEANARLIAAAPELLEFTMEMVRRYPNSPWIYKQGNEAIKKATESSPELLAGAAYLVQQINMGEYVDVNGHNLINNVAFTELVNAIKKATEL